MRLTALFIAALLVAPFAAIAANPEDVGKAFIEAAADMWSLGCKGVHQKLVGTFESIPTDSGRKNAAGQTIWTVNTTWESKCVDINH